MEHASSDSHFDATRMIMKKLQRKEILIVFSDQVKVDCITQNQRSRSFPY